MEGALVAQGWAWLGVALIGTALTAAYLARAIGVFLRFDRVEGRLPDEYAWRAADLPALALALAAALFGIFATRALDLLAIGQPFGLSP